MNLYGLENDRILEDNKIKLLIDLLIDNKTTMKMFIDFIGDNIRDIFMINSLHKIYRGLKERISSEKFSGKLSEAFLDFEVCGNTGSSENIFLLNLFCDIHSIIKSEITNEFPNQKSKKSEISKKKVEI